MKRRKALECLVMGFVVFTNPVRIIHSNTTYVEKRNLYKEVFRDPFEKLLIQFKDGDFYVFHQHHERKVSNISGIVDYLKREQKKNLKDIILVVHNHLNISRFTPGNEKAYHYLKNQGFKGEFGIYYPHLNKTIYKKK